jgi:hypothetical protein
MKFSIFLHLILCYKLKKKIANQLFIIIGLALLDLLFLSLKLIHCYKINHAFLLKIRNKYNVREKKRIRIKMLCNFLKRIF